MEEVMVSYGFEKSGGEFNVVEVFKEGRFLKMASESNLKSERSERWSAIVRCEICAFQLSR